MSSFDPDPASKTPRGCSPEPRAVHVRFLGSEGHRLRRPEPTTCPDAGPLWVERPLLMQRANGTYELIGTSCNLDAVARWILSFGSSAEVQGADGLRRLVAREARRILKTHNST